ncbi:unnamed protein product [Cladocopium goreaui]|uniref:RRM domain-containing protein n=1 Tax=Cladocopium goreaui TaxID=2562237 RepID=A0A9P1FSU8_9DINO|nr:unnamed protein product [Cladocopium goreaui]|mmetsp:Transcript_59225/g.120436  ORF Transcript_59225/g.120436 Transcript_59225/m.120436 type:complete len:291 (+) Transcript_59225:54-926(+)
MSAGGRNKTEDLLAAFRKKIADRIDKGERKAVHASNNNDPDDVPDESKRIRKAKLEPGPKRHAPSPEDGPSSGDGYSAGSLRNPDERKRKLLDGPLEPGPKRGPSPEDGPESVGHLRNPEERKRRLLDGPLEPEPQAQVRRQRSFKKYEEHDRREETARRERDAGLREPRNAKKPSPVDSKDRLGRGGRLAEKRAPKEVQKAKGRDMASHGTFSRPRTVKVSNIPEGLEWRYIKELFESAAGKVIEGHLEDNGVAWLTFEKPDAASEAHFEFDGGELADQPIRVELIDDD